MHSGRWESSSDLEKLPELPPIDTSYSFRQSPTRQLSSQERIDLFHLSQRCSFLSFPVSLDSSRATDFKYLTRSRSLSHSSSFVELGQPALKTSKSEQIEPSSHSRFRHLFRSKSFNVPQERVKPSQSERLESLEELQPSQQSAKQSQPPGIDAPHSNRPKHSQSTSNRVSARYKAADKPLDRRKRSLSKHFRRLFRRRPIRTRDKST
eukprot:767417_1